MSLFTEDCTYLLIGLGSAALVCLLAMRGTQQAKYLIWAGALAAIALGVFALERYWVTDAERIETVVYDLADAVEASDIERIKIHLDDNLSIGTRDRTMDGSFPLRLMFSLLQNCRFDFVKISGLTTSAGSQTRRGQAGFKATATGTFREGGGEQPIGSMGTEWLLSFRETSPGVWKVTKIQAVKVPQQVGQFMFAR